MASLKTNIMFKVGTIVVLIILLLIPASMVRGLIHEREYIQNQAIKEVSSKWGENQTITGPVLSIPYDKYIKSYSAKDSAVKTVKVKEYIHLLPDQLSVSGEILPEKRYRGIYEIVVYESKLSIQGDFDRLGLDRFDIPLNHIHFDRAFLSLGISDLKGIEKQVQLNWKNKFALFNPGTVTNDVIVSGINCPVQITQSVSEAYSFELELDLKGSQYIHFIPVGKTTDITLTSNWTNPSFDGMFLPDSREITDGGFKANWNILHLNRNFPQAWVGSVHNVSGTAFGVNLLLPVDRYQKAMRVAKYAILFIVLTFMVFFFVEVLNKIFIHPIQYILVGIALVVFYSLLLSFSEHMLFNMAYIVSAILTLALITGYVKAILKSMNLTFLIFGILTILYAFIFTIIQLQDYALLIGSVGVFIILALVMYFSRKIDWYEIKLESKK